MKQKSSVPVYSHPDLLHHHGVIEAHAGTGKTYTIVQMVLRILQSPIELRGREKVYPDLRNILLVTYTEKAAGELQERIREGLQETIETISENQEMINHLQKNLDNLHEAWIGTIHSTCQRVLQSYPFETGLQFQTTMTADNQGLESELRNILRNEWMSDPVLQQSRELMESFGNALRPKDLQSIQEVANILLNPFATLPDGRDQKTYYERMQMTIEQAKEQAKEQPNVQNQAQGSLELLELLDAYATACKKALPIVQKGRTGNTQNTRINFLTNTMALCRRILIGKEPIQQKLISAANNEGKNLFAKTMIKNHPDETRDFLKLHEKIEHHPVFQAYCQLPINLTCWTAIHLAQKWEQKKKKNGFLSFTGLLESAEKAVRNSYELRRLLRCEFCYGIIDEFQDTSVLQWKVFSHVFLDQDDAFPQSCLYLVGDPKQSIYSFQGADVSTYLQATSLIEKRYTLTQNFRSWPSTIQAVNHVVEKEIWWQNHPDSDPILYPGPDEQMASAPQRKDIVLPPDSLKPMRICKLEGNKPKCRADFAAFCARAIQHLVGQTILLPKGQEWVQHTLAYNDFAILIKNHSHSHFYMNALMEAGIPVSKYKQDGIFTSAMARQVRLWIELIDQGNQHPDLIYKSMISALCKIPLDEVLHSEDFINRLQNRLLEWRELAEKQRWSRLIHSVRTSFHMEMRLLSLPDGDRQLSDLNQMLEHSHMYLNQGGRNLKNLSGHLRDLHSGREKAEQDANLHQKENESKAVQILTMHTSKGLQFPVVFLSPSEERERFSSSSKSWIEKKQGQVCIPMIGSIPETWDDRSKNHLTQKSAEYQRLLYVALTRPQAMLFVPHFSDQKGNSNTDPFNTRLQEMLEQEAGNTLLPWKEQALHQFKDLNLDITTEKEGGEFTNSAPFELPRLHTPENLQIHKRWSFPASYSSLTRRLSSSDSLISDFPISDSPLFDFPIPELPRDLDKAQEAPLHLNPEDLVEDTTLSVAKTSVVESPVDGGTFDSSKLIVPAGSAAGSAWHNILEILCLQEDPLAMPEEELNDLIMQELQDGGLTTGKSSEQQQAMIHFSRRICLAAVGAEWKIAEQLFCPARLPLKDRMPEMEFLLDSNGEITGFIDLVFRLPAQDGDSSHPWKYFVLDWKSNWLPEYSSAAILQSVTEHHYDMQAKIYCLALDRWLRTFISDYKPAVHLGGALYVYLRGLLPDDTGVANASASSTEDTFQPLWFWPANAQESVDEAQQVLQKLQELRKT